MAVVRYSIYEIIGFLVTHFGSFRVDLSDDPPSEPIILDLKLLFIWTFFIHLLQVEIDLLDNPTPEFLSLPLLHILKCTLSTVFLTVY